MKAVCEKLLFIKENCFILVDLNVESVIDSAFFIIKRIK